VNAPQRWKEIRNLRTPATTSATVSKSAAVTGAGRQGQSKVTCGGIPSVAADVRSYHWPTTGDVSGKSRSIEDSLTTPSLSSGANRQRQRESKNPTPPKSGHPRVSMKPGALQ
jgi:hypothetical protein